MSLDGFHDLQVYAVQAIHALDNGFIDVLGIHLGRIGPAGPEVRLNEQIVERSHVQRKLLAVLGHARAFLGNPLQSRACEWQ